LLGQDLKLAFLLGTSNMHWFGIEPLSQEGKSLQGDRK